MKKQISEVFTNSLKLLSPSSKLKLVKYSVLNLLLSFLDLIGVILIGLVGGLALNGVRSINPQGKIQQILEIFDFDFKKGFQFFLHIYLIWYNL
jgi:hypothetical protein